MSPILTTGLRAGAWLLVGAAVGVGHAWLIWRSLVGASAADDARAAGRHVSRRLPLRLLAVAPALVLAARSGLMACLGLALGLFAGRWVTVVWVEHSRDIWSRQG